MSNAPTDDERTDAAGRPASTGTGLGVADAGAFEPDAPVERWRRTRWVLTRRLCFGGLAGALVFFLLSMSPSLVPRAPLMQGTVSGVSVAIGYGLGSAMSAGLRRAVTEPSARVKHIAWRVLGGAAVVLGASSLYW